MSSSLTSSSNESIWQKIQRQKQEFIDEIEANDEERERKIRMIEGFYATCLWTVLGNPFQFIDSTASDPHVSKTHTPAYKHTCFVDVANVHVDDKFWESTYRNPVEGTRSNYHTINSEQDVRAQCVILLQSIIEGLMPNQEINLAQKITVAGVECNIVLLYGTQRIPFAAIEVKKPGPKLHGNTSGMGHLHEIDEVHNHHYVYRHNWDKHIFSGKEETICDDWKPESGKVMGQHFDQLNTLELGGYTALYGMITNGNTWMMTQNNQGEDFPEEGPNKGRPFSEKACDIATTGISPEQQTIFNTDAADTGHEEDRVETEGRNAMEESQRVLTVSQPVSFFNSPEHCIYLIRTFILRAYNRLSEKDTVKGSKRSCRVLTITTDNTDLSELNEDRFSFQLVHVKEPTPTDLSNRINFPNGKLENIHLIKNIGAGTNGDCCLAMDLTGKNYCAVKFFLRPEYSENSDTSTLAKEEYDMWMKIYPELKDYIHLEKRTVDKAFLCMPYLEPISNLERLQLTADDNNGSLVTALREMVKNDWVHQYLVWRHIGKFGDKLCFLDFGMDGMTEAPITEQAKELWVQKGFTILKARAGHQELSTPTHKKQKM
eukprot:scaffold81629_cov56-Attheya_sp.AAC.1